MKGKVIFMVSKAICVFMTLIFGFAMLTTKVLLSNSDTISAHLGHKTSKIDLSDPDAVDPEDVDNPKYPWYFKNKYPTLAGLKEATDAKAEEVEKEGAVLLQNNGALPLPKGSKISFFSVGTMRPNYAGQGSHGVNDYTTKHTYLKAFQESGFEVNQVLWDKYVALHGLDANKDLDGRNQYRRNRHSSPASARIGDIPWDILYTNANEDLQTSVSEYGDAAIFNLTRMGGEGVDLYPGKYADGEDMLKLNSNERSVLVGLTQLKKEGKIKKIIINLNLMNMMGMEFVNDPNIEVDAIIWTGGMGESGIYAVPKLLDGTYNFSGSLPFTLYYDNLQNPATANFYDKAKADEFKSGYESTLIHYTNAREVFKGLHQGYTSYTVYQEGIYVGYRYSETRYEDKVLDRPNTGDFNYKQTIAYPFGEGLSYTKFEYSNFNVKKIGKDYEVTVTVKNTGNKDGKKSVQVYAQKHYSHKDIENKVEKPSIELAGFGKTKMLKPNDTETLTIKIDGKCFAAYDANVEKTYVVGGGSHYLAIGNNSHDALNNILAHKGKTVANGMDKNGDKNLVWVTNLAYDKETYSISDATGKRIRNLFDDADWNKYSGKGDKDVTYLSRNNWENTLMFYGEHVELDMTEQLILDQIKWFDSKKSQLPDDYKIPTDDVAYPIYGRDFSKDPLKDESGNVILDKNLTLVDLRVDANGDSIPLDDPLWDALMDQLSWDETVRLVRDGFRFTGSVESIAKPRTLDHNESNGIAQPFNTNQNPDRKSLAVLKNDPDQNSMAQLWPTNGVVTATMNPQLIQETGELWGEEGLWAGYSGLYGVGFNTYRTAYGGRYFEYFSEDPYLGGMMGAALVEGIQSMGMSCYIKHLALNDNELSRKGGSRWINEQAFREIYLRMFEYPITLGGARNVMTAMDRVGPYGAPSYENLMTGWLKNEVGLKGFAITDVMSSKINDKVSQIWAGTDLSDDTAVTEFGDFNNYKENHGEFAWKMRESAKRICYSVAQTNAMNGYAPGVNIIRITPLWVKWLTAIDIGVSVLFASSIAFIVVVLYKRRGLPI